MVLYFTGTGNSRYIAERIAAALEEQIFEINAAIKKHRTAPVLTGGHVILVTPTYAWRVPKLVEQWLLSVELTGAEKIWFVMNCGSEIGNAEKYNRKLAERKKLRYMGTAQIVMPENYIAMFGTPTAEEAGKIVSAAEPEIDRVIGALKAVEAFGEKRNSLYDRAMSGPVNPLFYSLCVTAKKFRAGDACIGCGSCAKVCPLNNITLQNRKPVWGGECTHCMACICSCPKEAIEYGRHSVGLPRYTFGKLKK